MPVREYFGDSENLKTNLHWDALYGVKTFF